MNVKTLIQAGKDDNLRMEMSRMKMVVVGVSEVRWKGSVRRGNDGMEFVYSGEHQRGVGAMMNKRIAKCIKGYMALSGRYCLKYLENL